MIKKYSTPWEIGSVLICSKCGTKYNQPELAEELKTDIRKDLKSRDETSKIRVMVSGCLGVCFPEEQTFAYIPKEGETEVYTSALNKQTAYVDILDTIKKKV